MSKLRAYPLVRSIWLTTPALVPFFACDSDRPTFSNPDQPDASQEEETNADSDGGTKSPADARVSSEPQDASAATEATSSRSSIEDRRDSGSTPVKENPDSASHVSTTDEAQVDTGAPKSSNEPDSGTTIGLGTNSITMVETGVADVDADVEPNTSSDSGTQAATTEAGSTELGTSTSPTSSTQSTDATATSESSSEATSDEPAGCQDSPEAPANGDYPNCDDTPDSETCTLICDIDYAPSADAECVQGTWTQPTCERLGSLEVRVKEPVSATNIAGAQVYVWGWFDPNVEGCADSPFCATSEATGLATIGAIPSGRQHIAIISDGYEELLMPVDIGPNEDAAATLPVLPEGYSDNSYSILLTWSTIGIDLDVIVEVPATDDVCLHYRTDGSLTEAPFAIHEGDVKGVQAIGPEAARVALNQSESGPHYSGSYRVLAVAPNTDFPLGDARPEIRTVLPQSLGADPTDRVVLQRFPSGGGDDNIWHAFNLNSDGSISVANDTEFAEDLQTATLPCVAEIY